MNDSQFIDQFEKCTLNPASFTHKAHLRLAWVHINLHGLEQAIENCCVQISAFATFHGDEQKFNKTITTAAVYAVYHFMKGENTFEEFLSKNPALLTNLKSLINSHYSFDVFSTSEARRVFLKPDVQAFI